MRYMKLADLEVGDKVKFNDRYIEGDQADYKVRDKILTIRNFEDDKSYYPNLSLKYKITFEEKINNEFIFWFVFKDERESLNAHGCLPFEIMGLKDENG